MEWSSQRVWITGASSGIGEALALELSRRGATLVLSARRGEELERVAAACAGGGHRVAPLDLTRTAELGPVAREVLAEGPVDVLVHNGGISQRALARETTEETERRIFATNYFGTVALTRAVLPAMRERGHGRLVVVTSLVGKIGTPLRSSYSASKHALHGYFEALRAEEHGAGIRVTLVCPGFIRTTLPERALTGDGSPQGQMDRAQLEGMPPEECARRIARAVAQGRDEVLIGGRERLAVLLFRFFPGLFRRLIRRARVT
ncbi:MAG: SDR family oxidoreductase [Thermoanaerobaculia bacterium]|nr:SDR family oxidoreductase [Thermoanaerobaculia bacterium]